jgi:hypothetical protein
MNRNGTGICTSVRNGQGLGGQPELKRWREREGGQTKATAIAPRTVEAMRGLSASNICVANLEEKRVLGFVR